MQIRDVVPLDFARIVTLNEESVRFLSPLTRVRLEQLHEEAVYHRVMDTDGEITAFLLALQTGCQYDSPNYQWFAGRFDNFVYVDRIVVSAMYRRRGIGRRFYEHLIAFARQHRFERVACEFDIEPPNEASRRFHTRFGFTEVGTRWSASGAKWVSFQMLEVRGRTPMTA